jgi:transposase
VPVSQVSVRLSAQAGAVLGVLLPHLAGVVVDRAGIDGDLVRIWVRAAADGAACPVCQRWCTKVRDSYLRRLCDVAIGGRRVLIWLGVRLLVCGNGECPKASFAEQPAGLATRYARKTPLLAGQLAAVAAALAGRAGSRLARAVLAVEVSRHTLIRLLMALPDPPAGLVRVLGVDDFSLRRGDTYATLLVDMEAGVPVGVLPGREAATFEAWLRGHPEVEVICRDRAGAYAQAAAAGAPDAVQVADRWHLWHNLCEHVRDAVARHRDCLQGACQHHEQGQGEQGQGEQGQGEQGQGEQGGPADLDLEAVIRERHAAVHALRAAGQTLAQAAAALGLSRQVTSRFWRAGSAGELLAVRGTSVLDPYLPYLRQRWAEGTTKVRTLHAEITALGYQGGSTTVYAGLSQLKLAAPARPPAPPATRQVTRWILSSPAGLDPADAAALDAIRARCPELNALTSHVNGFAGILTGRHGDQLDGWMAAADASPGQPELRSFTTGIRQDYQAVRNGLTLPWNSGPVEGLNTRTKLIKRQMYGRAGFPLLRKRILTS